ncbi:MAG: sensory transduction histidine kinase [Candidatus Methanoperedens nitroreducens]|uniref:histidine kinase n=1 Tax=Candidatus Methanoperedens nitratireducens TaxID=1392998 RepID=A0A0P8E207_9EURY|nr:MAG: sensory transduction histidine kinase [Candidatus Methanoperedens sp. BLZ1]
MSRLKGQSYHLDALEWQFERRPGPELLEEVQQVESQIAQTFDELMLLDPGEERLQQLHKTQLEFQNNMHEMFRLITAGDLEKADILDKERVDPGFNALSDMITNTSAIYSERADQAQRKAGIDTTLVIIAAGIMVGSLILRFQKMQLRAKLITIEQKVLRQSEERYRTIIETAHDLIWTLNNDGNFTFFNMRSEETSGYKLSELIGKSFAPLIFPEDLPKVHEIFLKTLQGNPQSYDVRVYNKDGKIFILSVNTVPLYENDKIIGTVSFGRDITEHKQVEEALQQSEEKYRTLIDNIQDGVFIIQDAKIQFANESFARIGGYTVEEVIGKDLQEFVAPEDSKMVTDRYYRRQAGEDVPKEYEFHVLHKDGVTRILINANVGLSTFRSRVALVGTVKDITERRRAEEELRLFRNLIDRSNDAIFVADPETGHILDANGKACTSLGYKREELLNMHVFDFATVLPDHSSWKEHVQEVKKKGYMIFEGQQRRKDGAIFPVEVNISYISLEKNNYILSVARDITERKRMENTLRESEDRYRTVFETTGTVMAIIEEDTKISLVNEEFEKLTGYPGEEVEGKKSLTEFIVKEDLERMKKYHRERRVDPKLAPNKYEIRLIDRNGSIKDIFLNIAMIPGTKKSIVSLMDITEHKRSEEQVREQAALLEKAQDAILVRNLEDSITYWNKSAQRLYGWTAQEAIGKNASELLYKDIEDSSRHIEARKSVVERGEWNGDLYHVTKDGREIIVESRWTLMHDNKGKPKSILAINTDITEKKKLEEQFLRAQRMESVGTLAGGIAHDINNVLTPIMLSLELLKEKFTDNKSQQLIDILDRSAKRGASLIKQVQSFARGVEGERMPLQTAHLISEIRQIAQETFPRSIEIMTDIQKDLWTISGDATQLHQVLMNLCVNARDAMPDGGILTISARNIFIDEDYTHIDIEARVGHYIVIAVTDTGAGIPPKIMDRMFEPFFTTKENGKGTGLGLSTALGIVKSHGGFINVYSEAGKGTTFKVHLPAITTTETQKAEEPAHERFRGSGELILIVDDEAQIRDITSSVLQTNGYRVLTANNGLEAIALYEQNREEIKIVLMDMMMPVMDGLASIQELRKINPQLKIIAASGLTEKDKLTKAAGTVNAFLPKPYTAEKLLRTIHEVLSAE